MSDDTATTDILCDACHGARATWTVLFRTGKRLNLCGHHYSRHAAALQQAGGYAEGGA